LYPGPCPGHQLPPALQERRKNVSIGTPAPSNSGPHRKHAARGRPQDEAPVLWVHRPSAHGHCRRRRRGPQSDLLLLTAHARVYPGPQVGTPRITGAAATRAGQRDRGCQTADSSAGRNAETCWRRGNASRCLSLKLHAACMGRRSLLLGGMAVTAWPLLTSDTCRRLGRAAVCPVRSHDATVWQRGVRSGVGQ